MISKTTTKRNPHNWCNSTRQKLSEIKCVNILPASFVWVLQQKQLYVQFQSMQSAWVPLIQFSGEKRNLRATSNLPKISQIPFSFSPNWIVRRIMKWNKRPERQFIVQNLNVLGKKSWTWKYDILEIEIWNLLQFKYEIEKWKYEILKIKCEILEF